MPGSADDSFTASELSALFADFVGYRRIGLAVSGGPDSIALLHLADLWRQHCGDPAAPAELHVLNVDHRLRPEAAAEAALVAADAARLGLPAETLCWDGEKPSTGLQAAARQARYHLLVAAARRLSLDALATGHTRDDQAETLLMRLARGSGVDGLAAMAAVGAWDGLPLLRPLLAIDKARLVRLLDGFGVSYVRDPSNADPTYERVRLRGQRAALAAAGLNDEMLALSARRLGRARAALELAARQAVADLSPMWPEGWARFDPMALLAQPDEIVVRVLQRVIADVGGDPEAAGLAQIEAVAADLRSATTAAHGFRNRTLARCLIRRHARCLDILREVGRESLPNLAWDNRAPLVWDRRFVIRPQPLEGPVSVRALTPHELAELVPMTTWPANLPREVALALPTLWRGDVLVAVSMPMQPSQATVLRIAVPGDASFPPPAVTATADCPADFCQPAL